MHRENRKSERTKNQSNATKKGTPGDSRLSGVKWRRAGEDPAEGCEGAPTGRALEAPQIDAAIEAGKKEELLRPRAVRLEPEVGIAS